MNCYLDLESVPNQTLGVVEEIEKEIIANLKPPGNYKKEDSIRQWYAQATAGAAKEAEEKWLKTSLNGTYGEIISISYALEDDEPVNLIRTIEDPEADLLSDFYKQVIADLDKRKPVIVGHNICGFDLKFIYKRSVINRVVPSFNLRHDARPWSEHVFDTMFEWDSQKMISQKELCKIFGIPEQDGIDGSQVWEAVKNGEYDRIAKHNNDDIKQVRAIKKRMTFQG